MGLTVGWWRLPRNCSTAVQQVRHSMEAGSGRWGPGFGAGRVLGSRLGSGDSDEEYESPRAFGADKRVRSQGHVGRISGNFLTVLEFELVWNVRLMDEES